MSQQIFHFTDLSFFHYCQNKFNVNRGVYNTIDEWFYNHGEINILERRKHMVKFLRFVSGKTPGQLKFGPGGLTTRLVTYWNQTHKQLVVI